MIENWITSPAGRKAIGTFADARPAWLWSGDGQELLWQNPAARLRGAKAKRHKLKLSAPMVPIKGQVSRLMRLGALGRSSLSRMQFTIGKKPVSATCTCTPLMLEGGDRVMLIVAVDPIEAEMMADHWLSEPVLDGLFSDTTGFAVLDKDGEVIAGDMGGAATATMSAGPDGVQIAFFDSAETAPEVALALPDAIEILEHEPAEDTPAPNGHDVSFGTDDSEIDQTGDRQEQEQEEQSAKDEIEAEEQKTDQPKKRGDLSALLEKLSNDQQLFEPLAAAEDDPTDVDESEDDEKREAASDLLEETAPVGGRHDLSTYRIAGEDADQDQLRRANDDLVADARAHRDETVDALDDADEADDGLWQIIGRGFERHFEPVNLEDLGDAEESETADDSDKQEQSSDIAPETIETVRPEQTSRYNFAELSRILNDRIAGERTEIRGEASEKSTAPESGELVDLPEDSLVLNRLPLGLLIFRDQQILFVNRAMTDLVGYPDNASLRAQGLEGIFPRHANDDDPFGPVTHLAHRNGSRVPVSARLQAISWQGVPALMLTARAQTPAQGIEGAIRSFTEQLASMQGCGYFETSRAGIISSISGRGADLFGRTPPVLIGRPLMLMADHGEAAALRTFLEQAGRKAETARPSIILRGIDPRLKIYLFAEGQAGFVTGYFGIIERDGAARDAVAPSDAPAAKQAPSNIDPAALTRLSRNVRRPLNTIIGFAELLQSHAFGPIENARYVEYARDIKQSGQEIEYAVDELEELVRIDSGEYMATPAEFDLAALLDSCISRVRKQAGRARVFVRSAISEHLPNIRADEASLGQAILNLLASAIDQTPPGGHVVVSAQREEDGSVAVHVRDSGASGGDISERFVVFREESEDGPQHSSSQGSSVGLALTRSLLAINTCTLAIEPGNGQTTVLSLFIPADLAAERHQP